MVVGDLSRILFALGPLGLNEVPPGLSDVSAAEPTAIPLEGDHPHPVPIGSMYAGFGIIWVNYNDLTATSLGIMVSEGNHPLLWPNYSG